MQKIFCKSVVKILSPKQNLIDHRATLSVFKLAQDYFSRGLKFARFKFAHPKHTYSRWLKFAHLSWIETTKIDQNWWWPGLNLQNHNGWCTIHESLVRPNLFRAPRSRAPYVTLTVFKFAQYYFSRTPRCANLSTARIIVRANRSNFPNFEIL